MWDNHVCIPFSMLFSHFPLCFASLQFEANVTFFCNPAVVIRTMLTLETGHSFNSWMLGFRSLFLQYVRLRRSWAVGWQMKLQPWTVGSIPRVDCWVLISNHYVHTKEGLEIVCTDFHARTKTILTGEWVPFYVKSFDILRFSNI